METVVSRVEVEPPVSPEEAARADFYALLAALFHHAPDGKLLRTLALAPLLDAVVSSDEVGVRKPDAKPFLHACKLLDVLPADTVVIGDSANDAKGARAAGCRVLLVSYGYSEGRDVRSLDSDGVVATFAEAADRLIPR